MINPFKHSYYNNFFFILISIALILIEYPISIKIRDNLTPIQTLTVIICFLIPLFIIIFSFNDIVNKTENTKPNLIFLFSLMTLIVSIIVAMLAQDSNIIVAGATIILVMITWLNVDIIKTSNEKIINLQSEPVISITLQENDVDIHIIDLIIENLGQGIAKNLQFEFVPTGFITLSNYPIEKLPLFQHGIPILGSKQKFIFHLTNLALAIAKIERENSDLEGTILHNKLRENLRFQIKISYESITRKIKKTDTFDINLCIFWGLRTPLDSRHIPGKVL